MAVEKVRRLSVATLTLLGFNVYWVIGWPEVARRVSVGVAIVRPAEFVVFRLSLSRGQTARPEHGHRLRHKARAGIELQNLLPLPGGVAGLLEQLPLGGGQGRFARIDAPSRKLEQEAFGGMAILPLEQNQRILAPVLGRENDDRPGMTDDLAQCADARWLQHLLGGDPKGRSFASLRMTNNTWCEADVDCLQVFCRGHR